VKSRKESEEQKRERESFCSPSFIVTLIVIRPTTTALGVLAPSLSISIASYSTDL